MKDQNKLQFFAYLAGCAPVSSGLSEIDFYSVELAGAEIDPKRKLQVDRFYNEGISLRVLPDYVEKMFNTEDRFVARLFRVTIEPVSIEDADREIDRRYGDAEPQPDAAERGEG